MLDHNYLYYEPLKENDVVLILGATKGDFIKEYKNEILQKNVLVINVEPTLEGVEELARWIKHNMPENALVFSCATGDGIKIESMDIRDNLITSTLESRQETNNRWPMRLLYRQKTLMLWLDDILDMLENKVTKIFADIEGSELETFLPSINVKLVPYISIAAYHMRDGEQTHIRMREWFEKYGYKVDVTGEASLRKEEVVLFARKQE